jgi:hypothetical protein
MVLYHLYPSVLPGGFAGVDVFFVISGYLITGHLWRGYAKTGKVGLADFWGRRARRLSAQQVLASALYLQNWQLAVNAVKSREAMAAIGAGMASYWTQLEKAAICVTPIRESPDLVEDVPTAWSSTPATWRSATGPCPRRSWRTLPPPMPRS